MRKVINTAAFILFLWLVVDALNILEILIAFLLLGEIPGIGARLSPTVMFGVMTAGFFLVLFEVLSRQHTALRTWRKQLFSNSSRAKN